MQQGSVDKVTMEAKMPPKGALPSAKRTGGAYGIWPVARQSANRFISAIAPKGARTLPSVMK